MPQSASHVFSDKSGMLSVVHDDVAADIVARLRRGAIEGRLMKARWTFKGILVSALCIITDIECCLAVLK